MRIGSYHPELGVGIYERRAVNIPDFITRPYVLTGSKLFPHGIGVFKRIL
jgi:hypothetical protein